MDNKTILVTGGSSGIGKAIVDSIYSHYKVVVLDKTPSSRREIDFYKIDLSETAELVELIPKLLSKYQFFSLINNAGYQEPCNFFTLKLNDWQKMFRTSLDSSFILSKEIANQMINNSINGNIINITSIHSHIIRDIPHYSSSKAALNMLTKEMAFSLAKHNIRVNSIAPGAIDTPMLRKDLDHVDKINAAARQIPLKKLGKPQDIANLVKYLLSKKANYITGTEFVIDGGLSLVI